MWHNSRHQSARDGYQPARTSEEHSDDGTLADENDLVLASGRDEAKDPMSEYPHAATDELALDDPLNEHHAWDHPRNGGAHDFSRWPLRPNVPSPLHLSERGDEGAVGLVGDEANVAIMSGAAMSPAWQRAGKQTISWLVWPLPSWSHRWFGVRYPEETRRQTDYLDGLRGVASLFVFFEHYLLRIHNNFIHEGYAYAEDSSFFQLPFVRLFYSGASMVAIFFIISGYVLSQRCVVAMRACNQEKLHTALTSMTFRRAIRLYAPSLAISFIALLTVFLGIQQPEFPEDWSWGSELENFNYHMFVDLFKVWDWGYSNDHWYARQLWTIPVEYRCSMVLFIFMLMVARTTTFTRLTMEVGTMLYLYYEKRWDVALFLSGMFIAELNLLVEARRQSYEDGRSGADVEKDVELQVQRQRRRWYHINKAHLPLWLMLIFGVYLSGYPDRDPHLTPGYSTLATLWEEDWDFKFRFWMAMSAVFIVLPISFLPLGQKLFTTSIARYLGKISYALYLVHELMNETVRVLLWNMFWRVLKYTGEDGQEGLRFEGGWILGSFLYFPLVLWAADVFWRAVDVPTVKFAKWLEGKCVVKL